MGKRRKAAKSKSTENASIARRQMQVKLQKQRQEVKQSYETETVYGSIGIADEQKPKSGAETIKSTLLVVINCLI